MSTHLESLLHSTSPSQRGESRSLISPSGVSPSRFYLRNEKENVWGHVHSPSKSLHHSTSPSQRGESRSLISPSRESPSKLYLSNEKENVWGHVHSPSKSLRHSESTCRIQITHQPQRRVTGQSLSKKRKGKCLGGMSTHLVRVFTTPLLRVNVENPDHSSAPAESRRQNSI